MRRYLVLLLLLASITVHASSSLRVGNKVLTTGDSAARVIQLMGQPAIRAFKQVQTGPLPDNQVAAGEEWQYPQQDGKTIVITVVQGRVIFIETIYE